MRYIKLFENIYIDDIKKTCEEILLELIDIEYKCYIEVDPSDRDDKDVESVYVEIHRKGVFPRWSKDSVLDYLDRIDDYLKTKGFLMVNNSNRLEPSSDSCFFSDPDYYFVYRKYKRFSDKPIP